MRNFQRCTRCVMDNVSDSEIIFDSQGICNYCTEAISEIGKTYFPNEEGKTKLEELLCSIKKNGEGKKYDCIMGLSGGLDSSYLAYLGYKWGLRVLAVHIDDGYDTEISKNNIKKLVSTTGFDYEIITPDSKQYNSLLLAFMKAGVPDIAMPQDNILFAFLYSKMKEYGINFFLSGGNFALESILQKGNGHNAYDVINIKSINKKFGNAPIDKLKFISSNQKITDNIFLHIQSPRPLNYIDYNRDRAFKELKDFCDFEYYGSKHLENILTAFIQLVWLPQKFGVDKRTSHLSSMIVSGQLAREEALRLLDAPLYDETQMQGYIELIKKNLGITTEEFNKLMAAPVHTHEEYAVENNALTFKLMSVLNSTHYLAHKLLRKVIG